MTTTYNDIYQLLLSLGVVVDKQLVKSPAYAAILASQQLGYTVSRYHICRICQERNIAIINTADIINTIVQQQGLLSLHTTAYKETCYQLTINDSTLAGLVSDAIGETVSIQQVNYWRRCNNIMASHDNHGGKRPSKLKTIDAAEVAAAEEEYQDITANLNINNPADRAALGHFKMVWMAPTYDICSDDIVAINHRNDTRRLSADRGHISYNDKLAVPNHNIA
jgi:hypothetical protein